MPLLTVPTIERDWVSARGTILDVLTKMSKPCWYQNMPAATPSGSWMGIAFPDGKPEACLFLAVVLDDGKLYFSFDSGSNWILYYQPAATTENLFQSGSIIAWCGDSSNIPAGWLHCNGDEVSRSTFADLFARLGIEHGAGNGTTTFTLPDLRGRIPSGVNTSSTPNGSDGAFSTRDLGDSAGTEQETIIESSTPAHIHAGVANFNSAYQTATDSQIIIRSGANNTSSVGSDTPHNNMPVYSVATFLIKT